MGCLQLLIMVWFFKFPWKRSRLTFSVSEDSLLPTAYQHLTSDTSLVAPPLDQRMGGRVYNVLDDGNLNLTNAQKELLLWHSRLGHFNLRWIQRLMRVKDTDKQQEPILPIRIQGTINCELPMCAACQYAKAH